jgi:hypothetical protein
VFNERITIHSVSNFFIDDLNLSLRTHGSYSHKLAASILGYSISRICAIFVEEVVYDDHPIVELSHEEPDSLRTLLNRMDHLTHFLMGEYMT